jgi:hypothetical protein
MTLSNGVTIDWVATEGDKAVAHASDDASFHHGAPCEVLKS